MKVLGKVLFNPRDTIPYYIGLEKLGIHTQGDTLENAYFMLKDAVSLVISNKFNIDFKIKYLEIIPIDSTSFYIKSNIPEFNKYISSSIGITN